MEQLDRWVMSVGETACRYLSRTGHDSVYGTLCSDGFSSAGWRFIFVVIIFAVLIILMWRSFRPAT